MPHKSKLEHCIIKVKSRNRKLGCPSIPKRRTLGKGKKVCANPFAVCKARVER